MISGRMYKGKEQGRGGASLLTGCEIFVCLAAMEPWSSTNCDANLSASSSRTLSILGSLVRACTWEGEVEGRGRRERSEREEGERGGKGKKRKGEEGGEKKGKSYCNLVICTLVIYQL